jgi:hypothetical protein
MRFTDFLKATVFLSMAAATVLALCTVLGASREDDHDVVLVSAGWWILSALIGGWVGRRADVSAQIGRLLAQARAATTMPEHQPTAVLLNRLWPLLVAAAAAAVVSFWVVQAAGIAAGFAIIWSLAWRHQESAVTAIEERDGATFFVERTSPIAPMALQRTPGLRRDTQAAVDEQPPQAA